MKTITLATFDTPAHAEPLKHRLEKARIAAWLHEGGMLKHLWFLDHSRAETKLDVKAKDFRKSLKVMHKLQAARKAPPHMVRCPECHSSRVEYPQFTRKFFLPNLIGLLSGLGLVEKQYYCEDCHYTWSPPGRKHPKERAHMAPYYFLEGVSKGK